jgi:hypothetical protein
MVQVPPNVLATSPEQGNEAARYLQQVVNDMAAQGWEFFRIDGIGVVENPGCLGQLLGVPAITRYYHVITFRTRV